MKVFVLVFTAMILVGPGEVSAVGDFKSRLAVGLDGHINYERSIGFGFRIGTDVKFDNHIEGRRTVHADQRPEYWLLTASHGLISKFAIWENKFGFLSSEYDYWGVKFTSGLRKRFEFEERWALSPTITVIEYVIDPTAYDAEWPSRRLVHSADIKTDLGLELEFRF